MRRSLLPALVVPMLCATAPPPASAVITTAVPIDTLQRCLTGHLAETGKTTPINTAAGVMLDLAFPNVGTDGKVATSHAAFAIDDLGTQRRITATAPDGADQTLAQQMLRDAAKGCTDGAAG